MVIRTLAMAVSSLVLAGCVSVGPNYKAPVQDPVVLQGAQQPVFSTTSPVASCRVWQRPASRCNSSAPRSANIGFIFRMTANSACLLIVLPSKSIRAVP